VEQEHLGKVPMVDQAISVADQHPQIFDAAVVVAARLLPETAQAVAALQQTAEPEEPGRHIPSAVHQCPTAAAAAVAVSEPVVVPPEVREEVDEVPIKTTRHHRKQEPSIPEAAVVAQAAR
jgi:hypothetical protein